MSKISLDGQTSWFISPDSQYGLSTYPIKKITTDNFSFLTKVKVDWDKMDGNGDNNQSGIVMINGMHMGITAFKTEKEDCWINAKIWTQQDDGSNFEYVNSIYITDLHEELEIGFSVDVHNNETFIYCNGKTNKIKLEGNIVDYSNALLWVGASMPLGYINSKFHHFLFGEISYVSIIPRTFTAEEYKEIFLDYKTNLINKTAVASFNFEDQTPYKILDISGNGNNLIKFDNSWMPEI